MSKPEYICLSGFETFYYEDELRTCRNCGEMSCPTCGGEIQTIEEHTEAIRIQEEERKLLEQPK